MHKLAEKIADCLEAKIEAMGIDNIQGADLEELGKWTDIVKDMVCYDKDKRIVEAMDKEENEYGKDWDEYGPMEEKRYYRGQPRSKRTGRYVKRSYTDWHDMEQMRDMDRDTMDRMYYTEGMSGGYSNSSGMGGQSYSGQRDYREGRSGQSRRGYMEAKETHTGNSPEDKKMKMQELEKYMHELSGDITEMIADASPEEKNMLRNKLQTLTSKIN